MAIELPLFYVPGAIAGSSFASGNGLNSTGLGLFVKMRTQDPNTPGTDFTFIPCSAATDLPVGVAASNPASGGALSVVTEGVAKCVAGGTIKAGQEVGTDASGKAVVINVTSTGADYGKWVRGIALHDAASGEAVAVLLCAMYRVH